MLCFLIKEGKHMTTETRVEVLEVILSQLKKGKDPKDCLELCLQKYPKEGLDKLVKEICNGYGVEVKAF